MQGDEAELAKGEEYVTVAGGRRLPERSKEPTADVQATLDGYLEVTLDAVLKS
jgi:hypothetical protein